jgi:DNA-binding transcriptional LysR family regulator
MMNLNYIEYAVEVFNAGSIRRAAQNLYLSQPYLSSAVKALETELGYAIFYRTAVGVTLTREGEMFIRSASTILRELKKIRTISIRNDEHRLNIATCHSTYVMEKFLTFHNSAKSRLSDKIREMGNVEVIKAVSSGDSQIGIIFFAEEKKQKYDNLLNDYALEAHELMKPLTVYVLVHKKHPLSGMKTIKAACLCDYPYVTYNDASSKDYLDLLGIKEHSDLLEVSDRGSFYDALRSGEYLTVMGFPAVPEKGEFTALAFEDRTDTLCAMYITARNYQLSRREKNFLAYLRNPASLKTE